MRTLDELLRLAFRVASWRAFFRRLVWIGRKL